jgi:hypothetical protein
LLEWNQGPYVPQVWGGYDTPPEEESDEQ